MTCAYNNLVGEERLPYAEGWRKSDVEITFDDLLYLVDELTAATNVTLGWVEGVYS